VPGYLAYLIPEGVDASDGRSIEVGALTWRDGNLPLMATDTLNTGHDGAVFVANLVNLRRDEVAGVTWILADVDWDTDEMAMEAKRMVDEERLAGISADISVDLRKTTAAEEEEPVTDPDDPFILKRGEILGGSIVPHPAFAEARISLVASTAFSETWRVRGVLVATGGKISVPADVRTEAERGIKWRVFHKRGGSSGANQLAERLRDDDIDDAAVGSINRWFKRNGKTPEGDGFKEGTEGYPSNGRIGWALHGGNPGRSWASGRVSAALREALTAASSDPEPVVAHAGQGIPDAAFAAAFEDPKLEAPTAIQVSPGGFVFGHLALWETCHTGYGSECVTPPRGSDYRFFHTGQYDTAEGDVIEVGRITMDGDHAPRNADWKKATSHYADTTKVVAYVRVGEDQFGIWVAGALAHGSDEMTVRRLRACGGLSGDWRSIDGRLELVAALAVNSGGFPVPRLVVTASGEPWSLVAAGPTPPVAPPDEAALLAEAVTLLRRLVASQRAQRIVASIH
jgi:hypothetical protein